MGVEETLGEVLRRLFSEEKLLVIGIGNTLRGDDGVGILVARKLKKLAKGIKNVRVVACELGLENMTYLISQYKPTHILIIDAVYVSNGLPGSIYVLKPQDLEDYPSVTTHHLPLKLIINYIKSCVNSEVTIIGIQIKDTEVGSKLSSEVLKSYRYLIMMFKEVISSNTFNTGLK